MNSDETTLLVTTVWDARKLAALAKLHADTATTEAIGLMRESGLSYRDIASLLHISHQRVHQLGRAKQ